MAHRALRLFVRPNLRRVCWTLALSLAVSVAAASEPLLLKIVVDRLGAATGGAPARHALVIGVETDILFPLQQQEQIADGLRAGGARTTFAPLPSPQGHDAFLVDIARFGPVVASFLATL